MGPRHHDMAPFQVADGGVPSNTFNLTIGNKSLHQDNNDNVFRIVNFAT